MTTSPPSPVRSRRPLAARAVAVAVALAAAGSPAALAAPAPPDADDPFSRTVRVDGIAVRTTIRATGYRWTITNERGTPVLAVSVPVPLSAGIVPPEGWSYVVEDDILTMTADRAGLGFGRSMTLVAQTPFDLAHVTSGTIELTRIGDETVVIPDAWMPGRKRPGAWWLTAGGVVLIAGVHLTIVEIRSRRRRAG